MPLRLLPAEHGISCVCGGARSVRRRKNHQDVVCQLYLGRMQGALAQMRAPVTADRLEPFAEPSLCIAYLATQKS